MSDQLSDAEFQEKVEATIRELEAAFADLGEERDIDGEVQGGVLSATFEDGEPGRFIVSPNSSVRELWVSAQLLDAPYLSNPLGGGPDAAELLAIRFDGFDCVTYVETVLALARSHAVDEFGDALREMRYAGGRVDWRRRNHYMADWVKQNRRRGIVKDITTGPRAIARTRRLSLIRELPARTVTFRVFPKQALAHLRRVAETG